MRKLLLAAAAVAALAAAAPNKAPAKRQAAPAQPANPDPILKASEKHDWRLAGYNENSVTQYIDLNSIKRVGPMVTAIVATVLNTKVGDADWEESIIIRQFNCEKPMSQMSISEFYTPSEALLEKVTRPSDWVFVKSETVLSDVLATACGTLAPDKVQVADPVQSARRRYAGAR